MSVIRFPIIIAEGWDVTLFDPAAEAESYLEPVDVAGAIFRGYDAEGRALEVETDGSGVSIRAAENWPVGHAGELEELLGGFLGRVGEPAESGCDLACLVAACDRHKVESPDSFRAILSGLFDDLWRSFRGLELRGGGR